MGESIRFGSNVIFLSYTSPTQTSQNLTPPFVLDVYQNVS